MRSMLTATLIFVAAGASAQAQLTSPSTAGTKPKPVTTVPIRPALQTPADTANAMAQAERQAIQSDLAWVGQYNGAISGEVSERMVQSIKEFQKSRGGKATGVLNPQERSVLAETAGADHQHGGFLQRGLAGAADLAQHNMAGVALKLFGTQHGKIISCG